MSIIKSISGIRGTIGGVFTDGLNPVNTAQYVTAFADCIKEMSGNQTPLIVVGRDARISGEMINHIVIGSLMGAGCNVINIGLATTPTTEMAVIGHKADGGIIITASHNPKQWNALKLLNQRGEFFSAQDGEKLLKIVNDEALHFVEVDYLGKLIKEESYLDRHISQILEIKGVDVDAIKASGIKVAFDSVNSVGGIALPRLFEQLGIKEVFALNEAPTGEFAHNPEPLPENLVDICNLVKEKRADVGFVVDPDVDRLSIIDENGICIGEEYTLVSIADYLLEVYQGGNTVSNLSSTRALRDITTQHQGNYQAAAVGEVNVVTKMKETNAIIGGEGNGGIIYPALHYGRDALVGIALFLTIMAKRKLKVSEIRATLPSYYMSKQKVTLPKHITDSKTILDKLAQSITEGSINRIDGVKIDLSEGWVHVRSSNTEPILRIYSEGKTQETANHLANQYKDILTSLF